MWQDVGVSGTQSPSAEAWSYVEARCGAPLQVSLRSPRSAGAAAVRRIQGPRAVVYLKSHREPRRFGQELAFYRGFAPALPGAVPALIAASERERWLLLEACPGVPVSALVGDDPRRPAAFEAAGRFARRLHELSVQDEDPTPLGRGLLERARALGREARGGDWARELLELEGALARLQLGGLARRACHRDFQPDNWHFVPGPEPRLCVLDFEHSRPDLPLFDLARLDLLYLSHEPELAAGFWAAYGGAPSGQDGALFGLVRRLEVARTALWAARHRDPGFAREAERMRLALERSPGSGPRTSPG